MAEIAQIKQERGETDQALTMCREALTESERLTFPRVRANILGTIARIVSKQGKNDRAETLQQERLEIYLKLRDLRGQADAIAGIAVSARNREDWVEASLTDGYRLATQISWLEGICTIGELLGPRLLAAGEREEATEMLRRSKEGFQRMRRQEDASRVAATMAKLLGGEIAENNSQIRSI